MPKVKPPSIYQTVIEQNNVTGTVSYWRGGGHQSEADGKGVSLAEYIHLIYGLLRQAKAQRILMLGCGGGTLATMLHRAGASPVVVDIDPDAFRIARRFFQMPLEIEGYIGDAAAFVAATRQRFDAIVLDAYMGEEVPEHLLTAAFFAQVKRRLRPGGIVLLNLLVADNDDPWPHEIGSRLKALFRDVRLLDRPEWLDRNAVLMAGGVRTLKRPHLLMKPARRARQLGATLKTYAFMPVQDRSR